MQSSLSDVIDASEVIIIGKKETEFQALSEKLNNGRVIIDLVRLLDVDDSKKSYQGMCW
jgi:hypothetical protein